MLNVLYIYLHFDIWLKIMVNVGKQAIHWAFVYTLGWFIRLHRLHFTLGWSLLPLAVESEGLEWRLHPVTSQPWKGGQPQVSYGDMDVSENSGTPKSSISIGVFHYKPYILGYPYLWKHPCRPRLEVVFKHFFIVHPKELVNTLRLNKSYVNWVEPWPTVMMVKAGTQIYSYKEGRITLLIGVKLPQLPISFRPFIIGVNYNTISNDRMAHLVGSLRYPLKFSEWQTRLPNISCIWNGGTQKYKLYGYGLCKGKPTPKIAWNKVQYLHFRYTGIPEYVGWHLFRSGFLPPARHGAQLCRTWRKIRGRQKAFDVCLERCREYLVSKWVFPCIFIFIVCLLGCCFCCCCCCCSCSCSCSCFLVILLSCYFSSFSF